MEVFVNGSWAYPYLVAVVVNTILSGIYLYNMFGSIIVVCYVAMALLLALQYFTNDLISGLSYKAQKLADRRV